MRRILTACAVAAVLSASACSADAPAPAASPAPAVTSVAPSASATTPEDREALLACRLVAQASTADAMDDLKDLETIEAITGAAGRSSSPELKERAAVIEGRYQDAMAAEGTDDEVSAFTNLFTAAVTMRTVCIQLGLNEG